MYQSVFIQRCHRHDVPFCCAFVGKMGNVVVSVTIHCIHMYVCEYNETTLIRHAVGLGKVLYLEVVGLQSDY